MKWFETYLYGRSQVTKVDGELSPAFVQDCRVPKGSILGHLMFSIYINDLLYAFKYYTVYLFADDTALTIYSKNLATLEYELNRFFGVVSD